MKTKKSIIISDKKNPLIVDFSPASEGFNRGKRKTWGSHHGAVPLPLPPGCLCGGPAVAVLALGPAAEGRENARGDR